MNDTTASPTLVRGAFAADQLLLEMSAVLDALYAHFAGDTTPDPDD